jgi:non-specific serine/threonine protein kinase
MEEVASRAGVAAAYAWGWVLGWAGVFAANQGDLVRGVALMEETVVAARAVGELASAALILNVLGDVVVKMGEVVRGLALVEESLVQARQLEGDVGYRLNVLVQSGRTLLLVPEEEDRAEALEEEGLELAQRVGKPYYEGFARFVLGHIALRRGELARAKAQAVAALQIERDQGVATRVPHLLEELAIVAGREGQGERAARLLGAAAMIHDTRGATSEPALRADIEPMVLQVRATLGEAGWAAAYAAGRALSVEEAIAEALSDYESAEA